MGAGAVTEEGGGSGLEPAHDSRWGDEEEWELGKCVRDGLMGNGMNSGQSGNED